MFQNTALHIPFSQHYSRSHYALRYTLVIFELSHRLSGGVNRQSVDTVSKLEGQNMKPCGWVDRDQRFEKPQFFNLQDIQSTTYPETSLSTKNYLKSHDKGRHVFVFPEACVSRYEQLQVFCQCSCGV